MAEREERLQILEMVREGKVTPEDGVRLLEALEAPRRREGGEPGPGGTAAQFLRIRIQGEDGEKVAVNIPLDLARVAIKFLPREARAVLDQQQIDLESILEAIRKGASGKLVEIRDEEGATIDIYVD